MAHSSSDLSWVTSPGPIGRVGSFPVSFRDGSVFRHQDGTVRLACVLPAHLELSAPVVERLAHRACQQQVKLEQSRISRKAHLRVTREFSPASRFGKKMKISLPSDVEKMIRLAHNGSRCDSETSSAPPARDGYVLELVASGATLPRARAFVPVTLAANLDVWDSAADLALRKVLAAHPSERHDRAAAYSQALKTHLSLVR